VYHGGFPRGRREFLAREAIPIPDPTINISCLHYDWDTAEEAFDRARYELDLDGIEWSWPNPRLADKDLDAIRFLADDTGLDISVHVWGDLAQLGIDAGIEAMADWLALCGTVGFSHLIVHGGSHDNQRLGIEITREILAEAAPRYEDAGVTICLENHYAYEYHDQHELFSTPEEFLPVLEAVDSPALRFCLDYGHSEMTNNTEELLERLSPYLAYTHLADNMGIDDDHLAFGRGVVPWREVLEKTKSVGYAGPFIVEFPVREDSYDAFGDCVTMLREIFGKSSQ